MIGDKGHICKDEKEIEYAIKNRNKIIFAYGDVEISEKTAKKIQKKRIWVIGCDRNEVNNAEG